MAISIKIRDGNGVRVGPRRIIHSSLEGSAAITYQNRHSIKKFTSSRNQIQFAVRVEITGCKRFRTTPS
jgi:hypothetical protein